MEIESAYALPSPIVTPYRTPSSSRSRQTSRGGFDDMSPASTPPPLPSSEDRTLSRASKRLSADVSNHVNGNHDDTLPLSDPRRFTPTLHASLVSEILSLRRDVEIKTKNIDHLEQSLHSTQAQNDALNTNLLSANKEVRQVKRQMQILEGGTLSAINELAKERDNALRETNEIRSRMEKIQKKAKAHEATLDHTQEQWQKDKESWAAEKRALETKANVAEGRLRVVLSEVAKSQLTSQEERPESPHPSHNRTSILESPLRNARPRRQSANSISSDHLGGRTSAMSINHGFALNLADELSALNDIEEDSASEVEEDNGRISPDALPEENQRPTSRLSIKAKKILGLPTDLDEPDQSNSRVTNDVTNVTRNAEITPLTRRPNYVDSGIQYSRPTTPVKNWRPSTMDSATYNFLRSPDDTPRNSKALSVTSPTSVSFSDDTADANWEATLRNQPIMVSSSCQTIEQMPSPPLTPKDDLILATIPETVETREFGVQTEPVIEVLVHNDDKVGSSEPGALEVPTITIIPPSSRPSTPAELHVQLPPRTKNVGCQVEVEVLNQYTTTSMQTEHILVDKRIFIPAPLDPPPAIPSITTQTQSIFAKSKPVGYIRRNSQNTANSAIRRTTPNQSSTLPPIEDGSPDEGSGADEVPPMPQFNSILTYEDQIEDMADYEDDDVFHGDEFFSRPTAKFTLQRGKMISQEKSRDDVFDSEAALIGERLALENIRQSEDGLPPFIVPGSDRAKAQAQAKLNNKQQQQQQQTKRSTSSRSNSIRRTALISSGTAAHQSKNSQSSMGSSEASSRPPPMPIPVRYSSARVGKAISDGGRNSRGSSTASPTKNLRRINKPHLRKTRSGPALSPAAQAARRERSKSPPLPNPRVSIVPEMPGFQMPNIYQNSNMALSFNSGPSYEASAPRPSIATGPSRKSHHAKQASDALSLQQTSVVDAIAQTMVGEWMYKYVRRRKSFGKPEKEWDMNKSVDELANATNTGVRHKRWVWLAPYERSVMWSSKQPADGTALMGKGGRKLTIKSVLDVKDDNPMPKGSVKGPHFNRSILILTPQRALKFTAVTQERHFIWLTALSFLSHSPISLNDLAPMPPVPTDDQTMRSLSPSASLGGSFRRRPIRDSIRIAKGSKKGGLPSFPTFNAENMPVIEYDQNGPGTHAYYDPANDAALPPTIRRYHSRNRSNTAPKPPPSSFARMFGKESVSYPPNSAYSNSNGPSDRGSFDRSAVITPSEGTPTFPSTRRGSEASATSRPNLNGPQFYESVQNSSHAASMTMRMDAFMDRQAGRIPLRSMKSGPQLPSVRGGSSFQQFRKDLASWGSEDASRPSMSPVESQIPESMRQSGSSMGRASSERDWFKFDRI